MTANDFDSGPFPYHISRVRVIAKPSLCRSTPVAMHKVDVRVDTRLMQRSAPTTKISLSGAYKRLCVASCIAVGQVLTTSVHLRQKG